MAQERSLSRSARRLRVTQPALSQRVKRLEEQLAQRIRPAERIVDASWFRWRASPRVGSLGSLPTLAAFGRARVDSTWAGRRVARAATTRLRPLC
ncbi:MAG TPA: LysR family transcriptional regulator [Myxococcus sp.]|nr:LysR family transcriptional regulator [Myxococcus sp.]